MVNSAPRPSGRFEARTSPSSCFTMVSTMCSPSPEPLGRNVRLENIRQDLRRRFPDLRRAPRFRFRPIDARAPRRESSRPAGMARTAFENRLISTRSQAQLRRSSMPGSISRVKLILGPRPPISESSTKAMAFSRMVSNAAGVSSDAPMLAVMLFPRSTLRRIAADSGRPARIVGEQIGRFHQRLKHVVQIVNQAGQSEIGFRLRRSDSHVYFNRRSAAVY